MKSREMCGAVYKYFFKLQMYSSKSEGLSHAVNFSVEGGKGKKEHFTSMPI